MDNNDMIIVGQLVLNVLFLVVIILMKVRINMLSRDMKELKGRMEFSNNDMDLLADAIRDIGGTKF